MNHKLEAVVSYIIHLTATSSLQVQNNKSRSNVKSSFARNQLSFYAKRFMKIFALHKLGHLLQKKRTCQEKYKECYIDNRRYNLSSLN